MVLQAFLRVKRKKNNAALMAANTGPPRFPPLTCNVLNHHINQEILQEIFSVSLKSLLTPICNLLLQSGIRELQIDVFKRKQQLCLNDCLTIIKRKCSCTLVTLSPFCSRECKINEGAIISGKKGHIFGCHFLRKYCPSLF